MAVVAHPQRLTALLTQVFQRGQGDRVRRFRTRGSGSSHHSLLLLNFSSSFFLSFRLHLLSSSVFRSGKKARYGSEQFSDERNEPFLEFVKATRLEGDTPPEGFWFTDLLKFGLLGSNPSRGNTQEVAMRQVWLRQWGYGGEDPESLSKPFFTNTPGLMAWPQGTTRGGKGSTGRFIGVAQRRTGKVFIPVESLYAAPT